MHCGQNWSCNWHQIGCYFGLQVCKPIIFFCRLLHDLVLGWWGLGLVVEWCVWFNLMVLCDAVIIFLWFRWWWWSIKCDCVYEKWSLVSYAFVYFDAFVGVIVVWNVICGFLFGKIDISQGNIDILLFVGMDDSHFEVVFHHDGRFKSNGSL